MPSNIKSYINNLKILILMVYININILKLLKNINQRVDEWEQHQRVGSL